MSYIDFALYKETSLERWINRTYQQHGLHYASDMDIDRIADIWGIQIFASAGPSEARWKDGDYAFVFLNAYLNKEQQREAFFHEMCHPLQHTGDQVRMPPLFMELQETQAGLFQLYSAMPVYMLEEFKAIQHHGHYIKVLSEEFCLPIALVERRVDQIIRRVRQEQADRELIELQRPAAPPPYSQPTLDILDKLRRQLREKQAVNG
ncbi:ImmA/IrrE family metallo-endopeptidase [Paenibacillus lycopersici]|uniref:ImmA/IrrE family metallo-endopeptidase n=1 Tax=Paenibacillus lycopersici TaxID=2704462 RepID=A0A6C0FUZ9_9BACL|nr:ImmA/IrrE family metallo-endopeptidase [Paenibacillus lycopersici]QHT60637.1 ImmA/IrrE family metallo-endopeptidase [Paenibacillus lycopersici]